MPTPEPAAGRGRARLALLAPFIPLLVLLAAMGATEAVARDPDRPPAGDGRFRAASAEVNRAMGLVPSAACDGLLTAIAYANDRSAADGQAAGCTHGLDIYTAPTQVAALAAEDDLPPVSTPPGIPCYENGPFVKVLYIYDRDGSSQLGVRKPLIREIVAHVDEVIDESAKQSDARRHVRWLMDGDCDLKVTAVGANLDLDVTSLRINLMQRGFLSGSQKGLAFTEAGGFFGCSGIAEVWPDDRPTSSNMNNDGGILALVYSGCWTSGPNVIAGTEVSTHELVHTLGGVQPSAPHSTPMFHCTDESDVMCYEDGSGLPLKDVCPPKVPERLDCGRNDYFHPNPRDGSYLDRHWNTAGNRFLTRSSPGSRDQLDRPSVSVTSPGSIVSGVAVFEANADAPGNATIAEVAWEVNGEYVGSDGSAPFRLSLDTLPENGGYGNGQSLTVVAHAVDSFYRWKSSSPRKVTVDNPKVRLLTPTAYDQATGDAPWSASGSAPDGRTVMKVELFVNGVVRATDTTAPYGGTWDTSPYVDEFGVDVQVRVTDSAGAKRTSPVRTVMVSAPAVDLLNPAAGWQTNVDDAVLLAALPHPVIGTAVDRVEFVVDGVEVGSDSTAPYSYLYDTSALPEADELDVVARVVDDNGAEGESPSGTLLVTHGDHVVTLAAPSAGATVSGDVTLRASPVVPTGFTVSLVSFLVDGFEVTSAWEAPWEATWATGDGWAANGPHVISVRVDLFDEEFGSHSAFTAGTLVQVDNPLPEVSLSGPAAGTTVRGDVTLTASVPGSAGGVWDVSFYAGAVYLASDFDGEAPYSATWDSRGSHDGTLPVRAVVSTDAGTFESPVVELELLNTRAALTKPADGATVSGKVKLEATARTDSEAAVEWVRFYVDGKQVKRDATSPYGFTWNSTSVPDGTHKLKAVVITSDGRTQTSAVRTIHVNN